MGRTDTDRDDRLAEALRANLRRRKAASRKARPSPKSDSPAQLKGDGTSAKAAPDFPDTSQDT